MKRLAKIQKSLESKLKSVDDPLIARAVCAGFDNVYAYQSGLKYAIDLLKQMEESDKSLTKIQRAYNAIGDALELLKDAKYEGVPLIRQLMVLIWNELYSIYQKKEMK